MPAEHTYEVAVRWTGNLGTGTSTYRAYSRNHEVSAADRPVLLGSSEPSFRGDPRRWSPEDLLVAALAQCHLLWYLHLASVAGVVVTAYTDTPLGTMVLEPDGGGYFTRVLLRPVVTVQEASMLDPALAVHHEANAKCFLARSMNFPVVHEPSAIVE